MKGEWGRKGREEGRKEGRGLRVRGLKEEVEVLKRGRIRGRKKSKGGRKEGRTKKGRVERRKG